MLNYLQTYYSLFLFFLTSIHGINYPPRFIEMPARNITYIPGEAAIVHCIADASPPPKYKWYKHDSEFNWAANAGRYTKWPNEGTLVFSVPQVDDDGIYQCEASNQFGKAMSVKVNVRRAEMGQFKEVPIRKKVLNEGESVILHCNVPVGYPSPVVTWQIRQDNQIRYIKETNRFGTDIDGNLLIGAIEYAEHNSIFQCVANNEVMRVQVSGPEYRILVRKPYTSYPIIRMYTTPRRTIAVAGDYLSLKCFYGGSPLPTYEWYKDNQILDLPNVRMSNIGTLLEFIPVTVESEGFYRCQGQSESRHQPLESDFEVIVKTRPKLIKYPVDTIVPMEGSVEFECTAEGNPQPLIIWTVNGDDPAKYLNGNNKRIEGSKMILTNLTVNDIAVVQCNASNPHGYDYVNAFVNVMREPPFFVEKPQHEIRVAEGSQVTINCKTFSGPPAVITWTKDGRPINGGRYKALLSGDLQLESVSVTDSGIYECIATNPYGARKSSGTLIVRRKTSVVLSPYNTRTYEGDVIKFVCTADTDPAELENLQIQWYKDDNLIDYSITPRIQPVWFDYSLIISGAQPRDTGQYICNATNGLDSAWDTASLLVQGIPDQPIKVSVNCESSLYQEIAIVKWFPGSDNYAPIIEYMVEYSTQYESDTWYPAELYNQTSKVKSTDVKIKLRPHIRYRFRVRTRNRVGISDPSVPTSDTCEIPSKIPYTNPKELYVYGTTDNNLIVKWTAMPYIEHNAPNLQYLIKARCLDCVNIPKSEVASITITDWRQDTYVFKSFTTGTNNYQMETYKQFNVTIHSFNDKGSSRGVLKAATGYSGEKFPTIAPPVPTVVEPTSTGFILEWPVIKETDLPNVLGYFRGYRVEWCISGQTPIDCHLNRRYQDIILKIPDTPILYGFLNRARRSAALEDNSKESLLKSIVKEERLEEEKCDVKCKDLVLETNYPKSRSSFGEAFEISFERTIRQAIQTPNSTVDSTGVFTSAFVPGTTPFQWGKPLRVELRGLPGDKDIDLWLRIINTRYTSVPSQIVKAKTNVGVSGPVSDLTVVSASVNSVIVRWTPPIDPNGPITGYEFGAAEVRNLEVGFEALYPHVDDPNLNEYRLDGLRPNTTYRLSIRPKTASSNIGISNYIDVSTMPADQAPSVPSFIIDNLKNDSFQIIYEPSKTGLPGSVFFAQYREVGIIWWSETQRLFMNRTFDIVNLTSDTSYEVRVVATNGQDLSTPSLSGFARTTGDARPGNLQGASATWFIIVFILFILLVVLLVLVFLGRKRRFQKLGNKAREFAEKSNFGENMTLLGGNSYLNQRVAGSISGPGPYLGTDMRRGPGSLIMSEHNQPEYMNNEPIENEYDQDELRNNVKSPASLLSDDIGSDLSTKRLLRNDQYNVPTRRNRRKNYEVNEPTNI